VRIAVCIKQVPDTTDVRIDPEKGTLIREGVPSIINPDDKHALEEALSLREIHGGEVIAISMGPPQAEKALRQALAMGVDRAVLLSDKLFAGSDTFATANALAAMLKKLDNIDLILCGQQAIDGDTAQVGPQLAERLSLPQVTYAVQIAIENGRALVKRKIEQGIEEIELHMPALVTATKQLNQPRYPSIANIVKLKGRRVERYTVADLGLPSDQIGLTGSLTKVKKTFAPPAKGNVEMLHCSGPEVVEVLMHKLRQRNII
jgi:electron transfer flavoprotein beta subunit